MTAPDPQPPATNLSAAARAALADIYRYLLSRRTAQQPAQPKTAKESLP